MLLAILLALLFILRNSIRYAEDVHIISLIQGYSFITLSILTYVWPVLMYIFNKEIALKIKHFLIAFYQVEFITGVVFGFYIVISRFGDDSSG